MVSSAKLPQGRNRIAPYETHPSPSVTQKIRLNGGCSKNQNRDNATIVNQIGEMSSEQITAFNK